jgi:hypothetical protein
MKFYGMLFKHLYKQSGRWKDVVDTLGTVHRLL